MLKGKKLALIKLASKIAIRNANHSIKKFKPTKKERESFVFVGVKGGRLKFTERSKKGYLVYVDSKGHKSLQKTYKDKGKYFIPKPKRFISYEVTMLPNRKKALAKLEEKKIINVTHKYKTHIVRAPKLNFYSVAEKVAKDLKKRVTEARGASQLRINCIILLSNGKMVQFHADFFKPQLVNVKPTVFLKFCRSKLYFFFASQLDGMDIVTRGSAYHIAHLKLNKGKKRKQWKYADGKKWGKDKYDEVDIKSFQFQIERIQLKHR